jgi:endo-1,4-beta-xylanase
MGLITLLGIVLAPLCQAQTPLKDAFHQEPFVGAAINEAQIMGRDARGDAIIETQFDSISPENALKWENIHPRPGIYSFEIPDRYVAFGEKYHMYIVGHTLIWHNQVPEWVFRDDKGNFVDRETLLKRMREHIQTVVGRYKGRIQSWDVVNEVLNDDGTLRQSPWLRIIGEDYIAKAFQYAHEADPQAQLTYNDYSLEHEAKRKGALALVKKLKDEGVPITIVGMQGHVSLTSPSAEEEDATVSAFAKLGVKLAISELDIDVLPRAIRQQNAEVTLKVKQNPGLNPYASGLPEAVQQQLASRYADLFRVYAAHRDAVVRVTFWGVTDGNSWLNNWPVHGRTSYPLLFDSDGHPKPCFTAVLQVATGVRK